jgi:acetyltransferase-like isoleucine patch superfamily enzyme
MDPADRAAGLPDTPDQTGDIVLERDVWLATGVTVLAGVRIGAATVVAAGSVVTRDLPPGVLAAGVPARVIRSLVTAE